MHALLDHSCDIYDNVFVDHMFHPCELYIEIMLTQHLWPHVTCYYIYATNGI